MSCVAQEMKQPEFIVYNNQPIFIFIFSYVICQLACDLDLMAQSQTNIHIVCILFSVYLKDLHYWR